MTHLNEFFTFNATFKKGKSLFIVLYGLTAFLKYKLIQEYHWKIIYLLVCSIMASQNHEDMFSKLLFQNEQRNGKDYLAKMHILLRVAIESWIHFSINIMAHQVKIFELI